MLTEKQYRAIHAKIKNKTDTKKDHLKLELHDADRRYEIATGKMSEITKRVHELEVDRNLALKKQFLSNEMRNNPAMTKKLQKEYDDTHSDDRNIQVYEEVIQGYKPMSRRKNDLQEERNQIVKDIEELKK